MIQAGSYLKVTDNSGAKLAFCIQVQKGYQSRYAKIGDTIIVSIKKLRTKRKAFSKVKKGEIFNALIIRTKKKFKLQTNFFTFYLENSLVLLNKQNKLIGTRIFGSMHKSFRQTKYLKLLFLSAGVTS